MTPNRNKPSRTLTLMVAMVLILALAAFTAFGEPDRLAFYSNSVTVGALAPNAAPVITQGTTASLACVEDGPAQTLALSATDAEGDPLAWRVDGGSLGTPTVDQGNVTYTPAPDAFGTDSFTVTVSDAGGGDMITVSVNIEGVNDPPVLPACALVNVVEDAGVQSLAHWAGAVPGPANEAGQALAYTVLSNSNTVLFAAGGLPAVAPDGTLTFTPAGNAYGSATITLSAKDNGGGTDTSAVRSAVITVAAVNDTPVNSVPPTVSGICAEGQTLTATPGTWNDDADGNLTTPVRTYQWQSAADAGGDGSSAVGTGLSYTLTAADRHRFLRVVETLTDTDASGTQTASAASAWRQAQNSAPVITETAAALTTDEDTPASLTLHVGDADGDILTWQASAPSQGTATVDGGVIGYTPNADISGSDSFTVTVTDGYGGSDSRTVTVTVAPVNDTPAFTVGSDQTVPEDAGAQRVPGWLGAVSAGPANEAAQTVDLIVTGNSSPSLFAAEGQPTVSREGVLSYTPAADAHGSAVITLTARDSGGGADTAPTQTFEITVTAVNDAPVNTALPDITGTFAAGGRLTATEGAWSDAADGDAGTPTYAWTWQSATDESGSGLADFATGDAATLTAAQSHRAVRVLVQVTDRDGSGAVTAEAASAWHLVENTAPVLTEAEAAILTDEDTRGTCALHATDPDGDTLLWSATEPALGVVTVTDGAVRYTPNTDVSGTDGFTVTADDGHGGTVSIPVQVTVAPVNDAPTFTMGGNQTVAEDSGETAVPGWITAQSVGPADEAAQTVLFTVTDNTNPALFTEGGQPAVSPEGTLRFTPAPDAYGAATLSLTARDSGGAASAAQVFTVTVTPVNDAPAFTKGADQAVAEDCGAVTVPGWASALTAGPANEAAQTLRFHVTGDNASLFTADGQPSVSPSGTLTFTPADDANGAATVTVYVSDNGGTAVAGDVDSSQEQTFSITVSPVNDTPGFVRGENQTVAEDAGPQSVSGWARAISAGPENEADQTLAFDVTDNTNPALFASGGQPAVSPSGTLTYTPADNQNGTATVTLCLRDSGDGANVSAPQSFVITVTAVNDAPVITGAATIDTQEDTSTAYTFTVTDVEDAAATLTLSCNTGSTAMLTKANMALSGSGENRTLTLLPEPNRSGSVTVTLTATDTLGTSTVKTVVMHIAPVNDAPVVSTIANRTTDEDTATGAIGFTVSDIDTDLSLCTVTAQSANEALVPGDAAHIQTGGSGAARTLSLLPAADQSGAAGITVTVSDGSLTAETSFTLTVNAVDDPPVISAIDDLTIDEDSVAGAIAFRLSDVDNAASDLSVSVATANTAMVPRANITLSPIGADGSGTLRLTPVANMNGTADMTVTVRDPAGKYSNERFVLTVSPVNDAPVIAAIADQATKEDTAKTLTVSVSDIDNATAELTLACEGSDNPALLPVSGISVAPSTGGSRTVVLTPAPDLNGVSNVTLSLTDGVSTVTRTFKLTVSAVNDKPRFTPGADVTIDEDSGAYEAVGWASGITPGAANEDQSLTFRLTTDGDAMFAAPPSLDAETGTLRFTPAQDACGVVNVTVTLSDSGGESTEPVSFRITLTPVNDAPVALAFAAAINTDEDQQVSGSLHAADVDGDALTYELANGDAHGVTRLTTAHGTVTLNPASGTFVYVPFKDYYEGTDTFGFRAFDGALYSGEAAASIDFTGVNDAPVAQDGTLTVPEDQADTAYALASLVTDVDNTALTYEIVTDADQGGSLTLNADTGEATYTPAANFFGTERFTYRAYDGSLYSETATVTVTVESVNDAPTATNETVAVDEGQSLAGLFKATDTEEDAIAYAVLTSPAPEGFAFVSADTGLFTYAAPFVNDALDRDVRIAYSATDEHGDASTGEVTVHVRNVNRAPTRPGLSPALFSAQEDVAQAFAFGIVDPDGDALAYTILSPLSHGAITDIGPDGSFTYQSSPNFSGVDRFTFMATDPSGLKSGIYTGLITVAGVNDVPVAYDQYYATGKDTLLTGILLAGYDPDGEGLTFTATEPEQGTLTRVSNGKYTYLPAEGFSGDVSFTFTASDGHGGVSEPATVHIHVFGTGGGPGKWVDYIQNRWIPENSTDTVTVGTSSIVFGTASATSANTWLLDASGITCIVDENNIVLTLTPKAYRTGQTVITLTVRDAGGTTFVRTFVLTVTRVNYSPTATAMARTIDENSEMYEFVTGSDPNGDGLTFALAEGISGHTFTFNPDGTYYFRPRQNFAGEVKFTFTASDGEATSAPATVTITVEPVPMAPTAADQALETDEDTPVTGMATGTEPHGGTLVYSLVQNGRLGSATVAEDGAFTYTPRANLYGEDYFTFKATGPDGLCSTVARVSITIAPVNDLPEMSARTVTAYEDHTASGYLRASDVDLGDILTYALVDTEGDLQRGTVTLDSKTGQYTYTPAANENGVDYFHALARDTASATQPVRITVNIVPQNDAPQAVDTSITVSEDTSVTASVAPFYTDVDGDSQTLSAVQSPAKGTVTFAKDGTYTYTPYPNVNGVDYFTFRTRDSGGLSSNVALATVLITPVNDVPTVSVPDVWSIHEDSHDQVFTFTVGDVEDAATALTVSGAWDTDDIDAVSFHGTGSSRWMTVTPKDDFQSVTVIRITVADTGHDGTLYDDVKTATQTVTVTVEPVNDTPTINGLDEDGKPIHKAVTINEDTSTDAIGFTIGDEETPAADLSVTKASSNTALAPLSGIVLGGEGAERTVTMTPAKDKNGSVRVTVRAGDGNTSLSGYVDITVLPVNDAPTVTPPAAQTIPEDSATDILYFTLADIDSAVTGITVSAASSNEGIVAPGGITLAGNGAERTVCVRPLPNAYGDVTITLTADDHGGVNNLGSATFVVHVTPVNDAPAIAAIQNYAIDEDSATGPIPVLLSDIDSDVAALALTGVSGNPTLIDAGGIAFGTDAENGSRTVVLTPKANMNGSALITLRATDAGGGFTTRSFTLTVRPVNDAPTITPIADQTILEDKATGLITFTVADIDNDVLDLSVTGASLDTAVIPSGNIAISGNGAERTVRVTPAANQNGDIPVTLTVTDPGTLTGTSTFVVHITPVNDRPAFTVGQNQRVLEDCGAQTVSGFLTGITRGQPNEAAQRLTFHLSADAAALFAPDGQPAIDEDGTLTYTPAPDQNGTATLTVYATDDGGTVSGGVDTSLSATFTITVDAVNDQPSFTDLGGITVSEDAALATRPWVNAATIRVGPANETQTHTFVLLSTTVTSFAGNTAASLFATAPSVDAATGAVTFQPKANISGTATLTVALKDNGGTLNGGVDTSETHTLVITVNAVDDIPVFTVINSTVTVLEDSAAYSAANARSIGPGGASDEAGQTLTFTLTNNNNPLFETQPAMTAAGLLTFKPARDMNGNATVTVKLFDGNGYSANKTFTIKVTAVNDAPSFTGGADQEVWEDVGPVTVAAWATAISKGPANESTQALAFTVTNDNSALFTTGGQPTVDTTTGQLAYTPAPDAYGTATVTVTLSDNGGTASGGVSTSAAYPFRITVLPVNDQPSFTDTGDITTSEDSGAQTVPFVSAGSQRLGPANEAAQTGTYSIDAVTELSLAGNTALFSAGPGIDPVTGAISFTPMANASGAVQLTVRLRDDGGTERSGVNTSAAHLVTLTVNAQNDAPSFTLGGKVTIHEDSGAYRQFYATDIAPGGGTDEAAQTLAFTLSGYNASLFAAAPAIDADGRLTFTPAADMYGSTNVTVSLSDGIASTTGSFTIEILSVNDQPRFTVGADQSVREDSGAAAVPGWATGLSRGAANENAQTLTFRLENDNAALFTEGGQPSVDASGTLRFTSAPDAFGKANLTLTLSDNGGTDRGGVDTSVSRTFVITVRPVNDQPSFTDAGSVSVTEDCGPYAAPWADVSTLTVGPANETQAHAFAVLDISVESLAGNTLLFETLPTVGRQDGVLRFTPKANASGVARVSVALRDEDGTVDGGLDQSVTHTFTITVTAENDPPLFTLGGPVSVLEDSGDYSRVIATDIAPGGGSDETEQPLTFTLSGYDAALFAAAPAIDGEGRLTFRTADNQYGETTVTVTLSDGEGTTTDTFTLTVLPVNDEPTFVKGPDQQVLEDGGAKTHSPLDAAVLMAAEDDNTQTVPGWASSITRGPDNESEQTLAFQTENDNPALFTPGGQPALSEDGTLRYTPAKDANGKATVTLYLKDSGGTDYDGVDRSEIASFVIDVLPVNDQPSFADQGPITVQEDSGAYSRAWVQPTGLFIGPANERQTYHCQITDTVVDTLAGNTRLFSAGPAIDPATGAVSFTPESNASGTARVTVTIQDDDGTDNGGVDTSDPHTLIITVTPVNDPPTFTLGDDITVLEDTGIGGHAFVSGVTPGGGTDEAAQPLTFTLSGYNTSLFSSAPSVYSSGQLSFTGAADAFGTTAVTVKLSDGESTTTDTFNITLLPVNDAPSFGAGADQQVAQNAGTQSVGGWARSISRGPANESGQGVSFHVTNNNSGLFTAGGQPAISASGTLTYTPTATAAGTATVTATLVDSGGTDNGGDNTSAGQNFAITVLPADGTLTTDLTVTLVWQDQDDQDGLRPSRATVYLFDQSGVIDRQTLTQGDSWAHTFTKLPLLTASGQPIEYRVVEAAIEKYHISYAYAPGAVRIDNIHMADPFEMVRGENGLYWLDYGIPLGANSNMNEGECFN